MDNFGSRLKNALGALLLLGFALGAWAVTITLNGGSNGSVTCTATTDIAVSGTTGNVTANVTAGTTDCTLGGTTSPPPTGSFTLAVATNGGTGTGTVTCNSSTCLSTYTLGTEITFAAVGTNGSTFTGWSGDCNGTSTPCTLTTAIGDTATSHSVTAAFTAAVSTGGDPGTGVWNPGNNFVHDRGVSELFVPRCVPTQYTNCRLGGKQSQYDTVQAGKVWALRLPFGQSLEQAGYGFALARAETGESLTAYDIAVSTIPGDFSTTDTRCKKSNTSGVTLKVHDAITIPNPGPLFGSCPLNRNTLYYLNVRPAVGSPGETACGTSSTNACRFRWQFPSTPAGFYTS